MGVVEVLQSGRRIGRQRRSLGTDAARDDARRLYLGPDAARGGVAHPRWRHGPDRAIFNVRCDGPFVIPVSAADALSWVAGSVNDLHLLLRAPLVPQAVFVGDLPNLAAYRVVLRQCGHWKRAGALGVIYRTSNPVIMEHFAQFGAKEVSREADGRRRYVLDTEAFNRWLEHF